MSIVDTMMQHDAAKWIDRNIRDLPERGRFRAVNAIRALDWADKIYNAGLPIPACYCALHATEEAVAAFVSVAKECGYGDDAKINIKDHQAKATMSIVAQSLTNIVQELEPAVAYSEKEDQIIGRLTKDGEVIYHAPASTKMLYFKDSEHKTVAHFMELVEARFGDIDGLKGAVIHAQNGRNGIFYADSKSYPTGFNEPEVALERECQLTLGLIWASIDIHKNNGEKIQLVTQALKTANLVIEALKNKK